MMRMMLTMLIFLFARIGYTQDFELDTREVLDVIKKWNFATNAMSESTFREIYADRLIFYSQTLPEEKCISLKRKTFNANRSYQQKIISDPKFHAYTGGVVKAEFLREAFENGKWRKYRAYLLVTYENNQYLISGESDLETDRKNNYTLRIGAPMDIPQSEPTEVIAVEPTTPLEVDSNESNTVAASPDTVAGDSIINDSVSVASSEKTEDSTIISSVTEEVLSDETVAVPKKYVYFLIGFVLLCAIIVLLARQRKRRSRKSQVRLAGETQNQLTRSDKAFENFVVALFDPHYFNLKTFTKERVYAGNVKRNDFVPSLEFEFQNKESRVRLAIECIFIPQVSSRELLSYSANQINRYHEFEEDSGMEAYLVIGLEGDPADPKELFLIPTSDLREGYIGYKELQPFKKHGMFFYNSTRRRLL